MKIQKDTFESDERISNSKKASETSSSSIVDGISKKIAIYIYIYINNKISCNYFSRRRVRQGEAKDRGGKEIPCFRAEREFESKLIITAALSRDPFLIQRSAPAKNSLIYVFVRLARGP